MRVCNVLLCLIFCIPAEAGFNPKGWMWYSKVQEKKPIARKDQTAQKPPSAVERLKVIQEEFENSKALAVLHPTLENVQAVMTMQNKIVQQAENFQEMWMMASLLETSHNANKDNGNAMHLKIENDQKAKVLDQNLKILAKTHGLFFMFKDSCPYCHAFAPVLKKFAATYGFEVKAISADGSALAEFPNASRDNGWIDRLNPERLFPIVFLVNPHNLEVIPLSKGMTSFRDLQQNAATIIEHLIRERNGS